MQPGGGRSGIFQKFISHPSADCWLASLLRQVDKTVLDKTVGRMDDDSMLAPCTSLCRPRTHLQEEVSGNPCTK